MLKALLTVIVAFFVISGLLTFVVGWYRMVH